MFKVNNKDTKTTSNFEQVNVDWITYFEEFLVIMIYVNSPTDVYYYLQVFFWLKNV